MKKIQQEAQLHNFCSKKGNTTVATSGLFVNLMFKYKKTWMDINLLISNKCNIYLAVFYYFSFELYPVPCRFILSKCNQILMNVHTHPFSPSPVCCKICNPVRNITFRLKINIWTKKFLIRFWYWVNSVYEIPK